MIQIKLPFKTPTINHLYYHIPPHGVKALTTDARKLRESIKKIASNYSLKAKELLGQKIAVTIYITQEWYYKNGNMKKEDVANREKFLMDSICPALGLDDKQVWLITSGKIQHKTIEETYVEIDLLTPTLPN